MGLDMYLHAKKYLSGGWPHVRKGETEESAQQVRQFDAIVETVVGVPYAELQGKFPEMHSAEVSIAVAYWRKVNAVHRWFVDNVQDGVDNCGDYYVGREKLEELLTICRRIRSKSEMGEPVPVAYGVNGDTYDTFPNAKVDRESAMDDLPPQSGFFFGDTDLDQWYLQGVVETITQLEAILAPDSPFAGDGWDFSYHSSW